MTKAEQVIKTLINETSLRAAILTGPWGVGKTFFVRKFIKENNVLFSESKLVPAYVSLFGLQSIAEARTRICAAAIEVQLPDDDAFARFRRHARTLFRKLPLLKSVSASVSAKGVDVSGFGAAIQEYVQNRLLRKLFVCIDDLERRSEGMQISDVLGLISELTEERECKCILILNSEKLGDSGTAFRAMEEKVFDLALKYNPAPSESVSFAINSGDRESVLQVFEALECANIRVMQRCAWIVKRLEGEGCPDFEKIRPQIVRQAACLSIFQYEYSEVFPDQKQISGWSPYAHNFLLSVRKDNVSDQEKKGSDLLIRVNFDPQPYDGEIVNLMKTGIFSPAKLRETVALAAAQLDRKARREEFGSIWKLYHDNFSTSAAELVNRMAQFLKDCRQYLDAKEIVTACDLLLRLDPNDSQRPLVHEALKPIIERVPNDKRLGEFEDFLSIRRSRLLEEIPFVRDASTPPLIQVFVDLTNHNGYDPKNYYMLVAYSDEEIEKFLIKYDGTSLFTRLRNLIERLQGAPLGTEENFRPRINGILERIGNRDALAKEQIAPLLEMPRPVGAK